MIRILFTIILIFNSLQLFAESLPIIQVSGSPLEDAILDYQDLQKEIDAILRVKTPDCMPGTDTGPGKTFCSLKDYCARNEVHTDAPVLYQNEKGEKIVNDEYYQMREDLRSCFLEKYAEDIKGKKDELASKLNATHLKQIIALNKKLNQLSDKYNQAGIIQKISTEILSMSLKAEVEGDVSPWDLEQPGEFQLAKVISLAEKHTKIKLNSEIKKTLVEIQLLKKDHRYLEQIDAFEKVIIPDAKNKDPFFDWTLLTDENAAGGKKALEANRARLIKKTQEAYGVFQETQKELLSYLESKKNENNIDKIERIKERVKTIRFHSPRLTDTLKQECVSPNAYYSPLDHSFTVCPQVLDYPKMALMDAMAHEISHSFDSCNFSGKMYKIPGPEILSEEAPFEVDIKMDPIEGNYTNTLNEDPEDLSPKDKIQDKIKYFDHPFSKTLSCLQDPKSVGAQSLRPDVIAAKTKEELAELTRLGQNNPKNKKARYLNFLNDHQKDYFDYFQGCDYKGAGLARSQMQEAFADHMASEIMARKLKSSSKTEAEKSILEIVLAYGNVCSNEGRAATKLRAFAVNEGCLHYFENMNEEQKIIQGLSIVDPQFNPHTEIAVGIDRNLLAHPVIRKALKCSEDKGIKYCE